MHPHSTQTHVDRTVKQQRRRRIWSSGKRAPAGTAAHHKAEELQEHWRAMLETEDKLQQRMSDYTSAIKDSIGTAQPLRRIVMCDAMSVCQHRMGLLPGKVHTYLSLHGSIVGNGKDSLL